jgi:hypothetical protein
MIMCQAVLGEAGGSLHYTEIAERILVAQGLRENVGATPAQTVAATSSLSLNGQQSPSSTAWRVRAAKRITGRSGSPGS